MDSRACDLTTLEATISRWPGVHRRRTKTQVVFSVSGRSFSWLSPKVRMVQIAPPLGPRNTTRRLQRHGSLARVINQRTGQEDAAYDDPGRRLEPRFAYPGFMCSQTPQEEAESLVRQAYERVSNSRPACGDPPVASSRVIQVPMEEDLVRSLDSWSQKLGRSRADIIREACRRYVKRAEREESDRIYREGYDRVPEEPIMALTQASLLAQVLPKEEW